jgi:crossover junction endonuclease MUS81
MKVVIDYREIALFRLCQQQIDKYNIKNVYLVIENLPLGDIIITSDDKELVIIERKSLNDLASSIKDGRYNEQSFRLNNYNVHNHNIIYLIEGDWNDYNRGQFNKTINQHTLMSSVVSINYYKGFSLYRTQTISESALYIVYFADKLQRENGKKKGFYSNNVIQMQEEQLNVSKINEEKKEDVSYSQVIKKVKKDNITIKNIGEIILSQIPNVSSQSAIAIMNKFKTIKNLINELENDKCLDDIFIGVDKPRKLSKSCKSSICKYLLQIDNDLIIN